MKTFFLHSSRTLPNLIPLSTGVFVILMALNTTFILLFIICALCISQNGVYAFGAGNIPSSVTLDDFFQITDDLIILVSLIWKEELSAMVISYASAHDHSSFSLILEIIGRRHLTTGQTGIRWSNSQSTFKRFQI